MEPIIDRTIESLALTRKMIDVCGVKPKQSWFYAGLYEFTLRWLADGIDSDEEEGYSLDPDDLLAKLYEYGDQFEEEGDVPDFHPVDECVLLKWCGVTEDLEAIVHENVFYGVMGIFLKEELEKHSIARNHYLDSCLLTAYDKGFAQALTSIMYLMGETFYELGTVGKLESVYSGQSCPFVTSNVIPEPTCTSPIIDVSDSVCEMLSSFRGQSIEIARESGA